MMKELKTLKIATLPLMVFAMLLAGCSSNKSVKSSAVDEYPEGEKGEQSLVLNGDSDSLKAGGLRTIYFAYDSSQLNSNAKDTLKNNAEFLKSNTSVEVQIEGHCDERGGIQYNLALGEKRAATVKKYLMAMGVAASRINTVSYGKERPVEFGHTEDIWSKNRRANFVVTAK